jgi:hypothetical protein
LYVNK